jgi:hypothetical protein
MVEIDADAHFEHVQAIKCGFKPDRLSDLFIIIHCEAFKHEANLLVINVISILIAL